VCSFEGGRHTSQVLIFPSLMKWHSNHAPENAIEEEVYLKAS